MPVIPLLRIKFYTMYQKAQDNFIDPGLLSSLKRKAPEGLISGAFRLPLRTIHFILPTGIIAYAFWCFKYSRMSNLAIQTATQNVIHWFLLEI